MECIQERNTGNELGSKLRAMDSSSLTAREWVSRSESLVRHVKTRCLRFCCTDEEEARGIVTIWVGFSHGSGSGGGAGNISGNIAGEISFGGGCRFWMAVFWVQLGLCLCLSLSLRFAF